MYLFKLTQKKTTAGDQYDGCICFFFFAQADLCGEPLCLLHIGGRSKIISAFTFNTHRGRDVLLTYTG